MLQGCLAQLAGQFCHHFGRTRPEELHQCGRPASSYPDEIAARGATNLPRTLAIKLRSSCTIAVETSAQVRPPVDAAHFEVPRAVVVPALPHSLTCCVCESTWKVTTSRLLMAWHKIDSTHAWVSGPCRVSPTSKSCSGHPNVKHTTQRSVSKHRPFKHENNTKPKQKVFVTVFMNLCL